MWRLPILTGLLFSFPILCLLLIVGLWPSELFSGSVSKSLVTAFITAFLALWLGGLLLLKKEISVPLHIVGLFTAIALIPLLLSLRGGLWGSEWSGFSFEPDSVVSFFIFALWGVAGLAISRFFSIERIADFLAGVLLILAVWQGAAGFFSTPAAYPLFGDALSQALTVAALLIAVLLFRGTLLGNRHLVYGSIALVAVSSFISAPFSSVILSTAAVIGFFFVFRINPASVSRLAVPVIALSALFVWGFLGQALAQNLSLREPVGEVRLSPQATLALIAREYTSDPASLFLGGGPNTFTYVWNMYRPLSANTTPLWDIEEISSSSFFLHLAATLGVPFVFFLLLLLFTLIAYAIREVLAPPRSSFVPLGAATAFMIAWLLIMFPTSSYLAFSGLLTGLFFGYLSQRRGLLENSYQRRQIIQAVGGTILIFLGILGVWHSATRTAALGLYYQSFQIFETEAGVEARRDLLRTSLAVEPTPAVQRSLSVINREEVRVIVESAPLNTPLDAVTQTHILSLLEEGTNAIGNATRNDPHNFRNALERGYINTVAALLRRDASLAKQAIDDYTFAVSNAKAHPLPYFAKANALILLGEDQAAYIELNEALRLKNDYAEALSLKKFLEEKMR